ncbi:MAG: Trm112 family protein [Deltaproteobacteria bacterium]
MKRVDPELVEILVCPDTKLNVDLAPAETVEKINLAIKESIVLNVDGQSVKEPLQDGLLREDDKIIYPVRDSIPVMLIGEGIPMEQFE